MKKLITAILALALVLTMCVQAMAEETGEITVTGAKKNYSYSLYRLMDLESYSGANYAYKVSEKWTTFFADEDAQKYIAIDENGAVSWVKDASVEEFAKLAFKYADENSISADASKEASADGNLVFDNLPLGYYLLDSTMGSLCSLNTTDSKVNVEEKNYLPNVTKEVQEDSPVAWSDKNTAAIGDDVDFRLIIACGVGKVDYILHDSMEDGLSFDADSVEVMFSKVTNNNGTLTYADETEVDAGNYTVKTSDLGDACDFHLVFANDFIETCGENDKIIVYYSAELNGDAEIASEVNTNNVILYSDGVKHGEDSTETITYEFDIVKTDKTGSLLDGAKFRLYNAESEGTEIAVVKEADGSYRLAADDEVGVEIAVDGGKVTVSGLDNDIYYLEETAAPAGYNMLTGRIKVQVSGNNPATVENNVYVEGGVKIVNQTGSELPSTGGIGTTVFYVVGGLLMAVAVVLLVAKKKVSGK